MGKLKLGLAVAGFVGLLAGQASAQSNIGPPAGAILDLAGTSFTQDIWAQHSVTFTATTASTTLTLAMRNDPSFMFLDDVSFVSAAAPLVNLLLNPGFETGLVGATPAPSWGYQNISLATSGGLISDAGLAPRPVTPHSGLHMWADGSTQAYDAIFQTVATTVGTSYTLSFWLNVDTSPLLPVVTTFNTLSTIPGCQTATDISGGTCGNGVNLLAYASSVSLIGVPEPATLAILGLALTGLGAMRRRRRVG